VIRTAALALGLVLAGVGSARAASLDRILAEGTVRCAAAERAGFAEVAANDHVTGLGVDLCRALAIAVLGPAGRSEFRISGAGRVDDEVDVAFLTTDLVTTPDTAARFIPGPPVFVVALTALAQPGVTDLSHRTVCFMSGSPAHQALEAWAARTHTPLARIGFQEEDEMHDAFDAHRCDAMMGEAAELSALRKAPGRAQAHVLEPLGLLPVFAAAPVGDGVWASRAFWVLEATVRSEAAPNPWRGDPPGLGVSGLRPGWTREVAAAVGDYAAMLRRAMPDLPPGPNALWPEGLFLPAGPR
jgi:general L-amino acid transport system substrate-binding protein